MAGVEANVVQEMVDQIKAFKKTIETTGEEGRNKLKSINVAGVWQKVPLTPEEKVNTVEWSKRPEDEQKELYQQLTLVRDTLHAAAELDGPTDPKHIMYAEYASNTAIIVWTIIGFLLTAGLLCMIVLRWSQATGTDFSKKIENATRSQGALKEVEDKAEKAKAAVTDAKSQVAAAQDEKTRQEAQKTVEIRDREATAKQSELTTVQAKAEKEALEAIKAIQKGGGSEGAVLMMVILLGALGGTLHFVSSLVRFIGNRQLKRSWLPYYLAMPFTGAGLAPIVYMLLRIGLINPSGVSSDGTAISSLNLIAIYAFAALTGMFSRVATDKLAEVFGTIFRTQTISKDALGTQKPPGGTAPTTGKSP